MRSLADLKQLARYATHIKLVEANVPNLLTGLPRKIYKVDAGGMYLEKVSGPAAARFYWPRASKTHFHAEWPNRFTIAQSHRVFTYELLMGDYQ